MIKSLYALVDLSITNILEFLVAYNYVEYVKLTISSRVYNHNIELWE